MACEFSIYYAGCLKVVRCFHSLFGWHLPAGKETDVIGREAGGVWQGLRRLRGVGYRTKTHFLVFFQLLTQTGLVPMVHVLSVVALQDAGSVSLQPL